MRKQQPTNQNVEDYDVVDNVLSKFAYPEHLSPRSLRKAQIHSAASQDLTYDDSYDSDDNETYENFNPQHINESPSYTKKTFRNKSYEDKTWTYSEVKCNNLEINYPYAWSWYFIPTIFAILAVTYFSGIIANLPNKLGMAHSTYDKMDFYNDLSNVGQKYKVSSDIILQLQIAIYLISQKQDTGSFMFVYNSKSENFSVDTFNGFVNEAAYSAAKYLRNDNSTVRHVEVNSSSLFLQDSTELMEKYKANLTKSGVLLLTNIDTLPSSLAMALHYYCDEYNPLVKKSAIFTTLDMANCFVQTSTHAYIEKCLSKKWHTVPQDNIGPLLTRVVSIVVDLKNVFTYK